MIINAYSSNLKASVLCNFSKLNQTLHTSNSIKLLTQRDNYKLYYLLVAVRSSTSGVARTFLLGIKRVREVCFSLISYRSSSCVGCEGMLSEKIGHGNGNGNQVVITLRHWQRETDWQLGEVGHFGTILYLEITMLINTLKIPRTKINQIISICCKIVAIDQVSKRLLRCHGAQ